MTLRRLCALVLLLSASVRAQPAPDNDPPLWSWFGRCPRPVRMAVELRVDGQLQKRAVVPLCHVRRAEIAQPQYDARLRFQLRGGRTFQGEYSTTGAETIQGDIWQAGADSAAVILGVSFMSTRQVLLSSIYPLVPGQRGTASLDRGIIVMSYPVPVR